MGEYQKRDANYYWLMEHRTMWRKRKAILKENVLLIPTK